MTATSAPSERGIRTTGSRTATPGLPTRSTRAASRRGCGSRRSAWPRPPASPQRRPTGCCATPAGPWSVKRARRGAGRSTRSTARTPKHSSGCSIWPVAPCGNGDTTTSASTSCAGRRSVRRTTAGLTLLADNLPKLAPDRLPLLQRTLPVAAVTGRAIETGGAERDIAPAVVAGDDRYPIGGPWRFRTGDDPGYGTRGFDEEAWETIPVPQRWDAAGHRDYAGFAWYRTRFQLPKPSDGATERRNLFLELGKIADADETFVNGLKVGQTGELSPGGPGDAQAFRRYRVPPEILNW